MKVKLPPVVGHLERRPVDQLIPYANNTRRHSEAQIAQIAASIQEFGFVNPILIGTDNGIIAGHARVRAAIKVDIQEVPVIVLAHLTAKQRRALAIADNQLALNAAWDEEMLRAELAALELQDYALELIGFEQEELSRLLGQQPDLARELTDADAVPSIPATPITKLGDLWILGEHRLLCGDATCRSAMETVLGGATADMVFTDPPYNVAYQGKTAKKLTIVNDELGENFYEFLYRSCLNLMPVCQGAIYICMSSSELQCLYSAFTKAGGHWSTFLIWAKHHFTLGRADYQRQYEPILYGWPQASDHYWCGARDQGDVWFIPRPMANREHPTAKPVELVERAIENSSPVGATVLDPFGGSGTTLIACQRRKRKARLIEIDPIYADVICQRWQQFCGKEAVLDGCGRTFTQLARERKKKAA